MKQDAARHLHSTKERVLQILVESRSFLASPEPIFALASGEKSRFYVDCKIALSHPEFRLLIGDLIWSRASSSSLDAVGGLLIGAYPIAIAVSDAAYRISGVNLRAFVVRKEPKSHGLKKLLEGDVKPGYKALIVDDVITSGNSTVQAIQRSREAGLVVQKAMALVDRQEKSGRTNIENNKVEFEALCTLDELKRIQEATSPL